MGIFIEKLLKQRHRLMKAFVTITLLSVLVQFIGASQSYQVTQGFLEEQYRAQGGKWSARKMMNMDPRWSLVIQNLKWLQRGLVDHMYYNYLFNQRLMHDSYLTGSGPPGWLGFALFVYLCTFALSGYMLFRILKLPPSEPVKKQLRGKKRRKQKAQ